AAGAAPLDRARSNRGSWWSSDGDASAEPSSRATEHASIAQPIGHQTTNLGVRSSNLFGRAKYRRLLPCIRGSRRECVSLQPTAQCNQNRLDVPRKERKWVWPSSCSE